MSPKPPVPPKKPNNAVPGPHGPHGPYDPMHHHHPGHAPYLVDKCADECDDQLPLISQVGRGLRGDSAKIEVVEDGLAATYLEGFTYDEHTGTWNSAWLSNNINGGHLFFTYNLRPLDNPKTFTMTFKYVRPGRDDDDDTDDGVVWSWTTPAIPYAFDIGEEYTGYGARTLYIKAENESEWLEKLVYPTGMSREDYEGTPGELDPENPWTVNLTYGIDGDIKVPTLYELSKIIGVPESYMINIINDPDINPPAVDITFPDPYTNLYDWIKSLQDRVGDAEGNITNLAEYIAALYTKLNSIGGIIWDKDRDNDGIPWVPSNDPADAKNVGSSFGKYSLFAIYHEGGATPALGYIHRSRHGWKNYGPQGPGVDPKNVTLLDFDDNQRAALESFAYDLYDSWTWNDANDHSKGGHYNPLRALGGYAYTQTDTSYSDDIFNANLYIYSFTRPVQNEPNKLLFTHPARTFFHNKGDAGNENRSPRYRDSDLKELNNSDTTIDSYDRIVRIVGII